MTSRTELVFILDKSGSMSGLESDTVGGFNSMLKKQQAEPGEAFVTTVLFDDKYELLHDRINIREICPMTEKEYFVEGSTALLDAVGKTVRKIGNAQKHAAEEYRADKVMVVIITDGMENASREYTYDTVQKMVERQTLKFGWEFIFLGANINAAEEAARLKIRPDRAVNYCADSQGIEMNFYSLNKAVREFRSCSSIGNEWRACIDEDFEERGKKE